MFRRGGASERGDDAIQRLGGRRVDPDDPGVRLVRADERGSACREIRTSST